MEKTNQKKRLLMLNYEFPPIGNGGSIVSSALVHELSSQGFSIDVVTMSFAGLPRFEVINENLRVHRVPSLRKNKLSCSPIEQLSYLVSAFFYIVNLILIKGVKFDICHANFIIPTGILALISKGIFKLEYILTVHGSDILGYSTRKDIVAVYPLIKLPWKWILDGASKIVCPSNYIKTRLAAQYSPPDDSKIVIINNGIESNRFVPMNKEKYFLTVSRLIESKGIAAYISALSKIEMNEWKAYIVGDGHLKNELQNQIGSLGLSEKVKLLGYIENTSEQMKNLYGHAACYVLPTHFENFNTTLIEALSSGCDIVTTKVGGNTEIISDQEAFFEPDDVEHLSQLLQKEISKPTQRINADSVERSRAFSVTSMTSAYNILMSSLLEFTTIKQ